MIGVVAMATGAGTMAYFSDTENSTGNSMTAGELDLTIEDSDSAQTTLETNVGNVAPEDSGSDSSILKNVGTLDGELDVGISSITGSDDNDPSLTDPEGDVDSDTGAGAGELDTNAYMALWLDHEDSGTWSSNDVLLKSDGSSVVYSSVSTDSGTAESGSLTTVVDSDKAWTADEWVGYCVTVTGKGTRVIISNTATKLTVATPFTSAVTSGDSYNIGGPIYDTIHSFSGNTYDAAATMAKSGATGDEYDFVVEWVVPSDTGNVIQNDVASFDATFTLEQANKD